MLVHYHILIIVMSLIASYLAIGRQHIDKRAAEEIIAGVIAIFGFVVASLSAGNIEVVTETGEIVTFASTALYWLWTGLAFVNLVYVLIVPIEELARSEGYSIYDLINR